MLIQKSDELPIHKDTKNGATVSYQQNSKAKFSKDDILNCRVDHSTQVKEIVPAVKIDGCPFAVKGDISIIGGLPKAGKTTIAVNIIGTALMEQIPDDFDSLKIRSSYAGQKPVFYIDTEQAKASTNKIRKAVCRFLGVDKEPDNLFLINLREKYRAEDKLQYVLACMKHYPDAHLWLIDGIADLLKDPNNTEDSFELIARFMSLSQELYAPIILYLHENPSGISKFRGNLGSEAERKCYGAIIVKKDKQRGVHIIEPKYLRDAKDFEPIYSYYDNNLNRMVSMDPDQVKEYQKESDPEEKKRELLSKLAYQCLVGGAERIQHSEFCNRIMNHSKAILGKKVSLSTAKRKIPTMIEYQIIEKDEAGKYRLVS
jgi:uncharacterized Zn-binding protein involved in type VI secretion